MNTQRLLGGTSFEPEEVAELVAAYEQVLRDVGLVERSYPFSLLIAKTIMQFAQLRVRDGKQLSELAMRELNSSARSHHARSRSRNAQEVNAINEKAILTLHSSQSAGRPVV